MISNAGTDSEQLDCWCIVTGGTQSYNYCEKLTVSYVNIHLPYGPAIQLLPVYPRGVEAYLFLQNDVCKNVHCSFIHNSKIPKTTCLHFLVDGQTNGGNSMQWNSVCQKRNKLHIHITHGWMSKTL